MRKQPVPPPYGFEVTWELTAGSGRFSQATGSESSIGLDFGDGTISPTDIGTIARQDLA